MCSYGPGMSCLCSLRKDVRVVGVCGKKDGDEMICGSVLVC